MVRGHPYIMSHLKGRGGGRRSVTLCDKEGGGILNVVTSHIKNGIKAIYLSLI